jgi:hypothetical protein
MERSATGAMMPELEHAEACDGGRRRHVTVAGGRTSRILAIGRRLLCGAPVLHAPQKLFMWRCATEIAYFCGAPHTHAPQKYGGPHPRPGLIIGCTISVAHRTTCAIELRHSVVHLA